jgi:hypothetical protein
MWYFTPKANIAFLEEFKTLTKETYEARGRVKAIQDQAQRVRITSSGSNRSYEDAKSLAEQLRERYSQAAPRATRITARLGIQNVFREWVHTIAYQQSQVDVYSAILMNNLASPEDVFSRAIDTINRAIGVSKEKMQEDIRHLINPFYWIYALLHYLLKASGASKILGEQLSSVTSKLLTAMITLAVPWIKKLLIIWFYKLMKE